MLTMTAESNLILFLMYQAGITLSERYYSRPSTSEKGPQEFVSETCRELEKILIDGLRKDFPNCTIHSEEIDSTHNDSKVRWIIEPLDGTSNFMMGIPHFSISIARETDGVIDQGFVYNPVTDEMFHCVEPGEAFCNHDKNSGLANG